MAEVPVEMVHSTVPILVHRIVPGVGKLPHKSRASDLGWDIFCVPDPCWAEETTLIQGKMGNKYFILYPGESHTFHTGIMVATPDNYGFLLRDRSSIGVKDITVTAGVIEGTYRGEWLIHLTNIGRYSHTFQPGDKIIQAILTEIIPGEVEEVDSLPVSDRGNKGWGSSGK